MYGERVTNSDVWVLPRGHRVNPEPSAEASRKLNTTGRILELHKFLSDHYLTRSTLVQAVHFKRSLHLGEVVSKQWEKCGKTE